MDNQEPKQPPFQNSLLRKALSGDIPVNGIAKNSPRRFTMKRVVTYYELCRQLPEGHDCPTEPQIRMLCKLNRVDFETMRKPWEAHHQRFKETAQAILAPEDEQTTLLEFSYGGPEWDGEGWDD